MKQAVFFVYVWPEARSSAAGLRTYDLIRWLKSGGWEITAVSPSRPGPYSEELERAGVRTISCGANDADADEKLRSLTPDLAIFDRFVMEEQFGWRARALWPSALQLIDTQDLHSVRRAREALLKRGASPAEILALPALRAELPEDLVRELSSLHRVDGALVVSSWEFTLLRERFDFPAERLLHLPLCALPEADVQPREGRAGFAFLGNYRHAPNLDGIRWFLAQIWPEWRKKDPTAQLHLYGAYPTAEISAWNGKIGISTHGAVQDHRAALRRHLALVAPLRFGAGIKGKVLEAWATGTPVIGTGIAFEGMCDEKEALRFDGAESFAAAAVRLETEWQAFQAAGLRRLKEAFSEEELRLKFLDFLRALQAGEKPPSITGAMLRHGQNNATKYFSRWIEAKNKKAGE